MGGLDSVLFFSELWLFFLKTAPPSLCPPPSPNPLPWDTRLRMKMMNLSWRFSLSRRKIVLVLITPPKIFFLNFSTISWTSTVQHVDECRWDWNILGMYQCRAFPWSGLVCWARWDQESSWNWTFPSWSSCHAWIQIPASVKWNNFFLYSELICLHFELLHQCLFDCCHHNQRFLIRELSIILYQLPNAPSYLSSMVTSDLVM